MQSYTLVEILDYIVRFYLEIINLMRYKATYMNIVLLSGNQTEEIQVNHLTVLEGAVYF